MGIYLALEIKTPEDAEIANALLDLFTPLSYKELRHNFVVLNYPNSSHAPKLIKTENFEKDFDYIENGPQITLKKFIK